MEKVRSPQKSHYLQPCTNFTTYFKSSLRVASKACHSVTACPNHLLASGGYSRADSHCAGTLAGRQGKGLW